MTERVVAAKTPMGVEVEAGKTYWWCRCGKSVRQPFCDGSHKGSDLAPARYDASANGKVWFCCCKQTASEPLCDGSHKRL